MPAQIHRNVARKVHRALFLAAHEYLLEQAEAHMERDPLLAGDPFVLAPTRAYWTVEKNRMGFSYVSAFIRFTNGKQLEYAWKVHRNGVGLSKGGCGSLWVQDLPLDKYRKLLYPGRARGGAVDAKGGVTKHSTRTRPSIGRAHKRRR